MVFLKYCLYVVIKTLKAYTQRIIELQNENVFCQAYSNTVKYFETPE